MLKKFPPYITYHNFHLPKVKFNWCSPIFSCQRQLGDRYFKHCLYISLQLETRLGLVCIQSSFTLPVRLVWLHSVQKGSKVDRSLCFLFQEPVPQQRKDAPRDPAVPSASPTPLPQAVPRSPLSADSPNPPGDPTLPHLALCIQHARPWGTQGATHATPVTLTLTHQGICAWAVAFWTPSKTLISRK